MFVQSEFMWGQPPSAVRRNEPGWMCACRSSATTCLLLVAILFLASCSPRDFLTHRLATDLISASDAFNAPQQFVLRTGILSNKDYTSPDYLVFQRHGWISGSTVACPQGLGPAPCWDVLLTPFGVDTVHALNAGDDGEKGDKSSLAIPVAKRELIAVTGISKEGNLADVEFTWKWVPMNEVGAALYSGDLRYKSIVGFRQFDDGWRVVQTAAHPGQTLDDALKNAEPSS